jgi:hypothetical protein
MLDIGLIRYEPLKDEATPEEIDICESMTFCLELYLKEELEAAHSDYVEAKYDKLPAEIVDQKLAVLNQAKALFAKAEEYARIFDDVTADAGSSEVRLLKVDRLGVKHFTLNSVERWIKDNDYGISLADNKPAPQRPPQADTKPWSVPDLSDPPASQPWYTPARYFARQLVLGDSTLLTKRGLLVSKVAQSLTTAGIFKRGGKKPFDPDTIKKALTSVLLG